MTNSNLQTYNQSQHGISCDQISPSALAIITQLLDHNYKAYIVGGAVRDLLLEKKPKDFDIATEATPEQVKAVFQNKCRIIGRRFRLAHVYHNREMYEVATFRGVAQVGDRIVKKGHILRDNIFGSIDQDAMRRDFTCNALYYDIESGEVLDFCGGYDDIKKQTLKFIGDATKRIIEDPIRMIRAIRFQAKLGLNMTPELYQAIENQHHTIETVSVARLFDELVKLFHCGNAFIAYGLMNDLRLFKHIFPQAIKAINANNNNVTLINNALKSTDSRIAQNKSVTPIFLFACFLWPLALKNTQIYLEKGTSKYDAIQKAANEVFLISRERLAIPKIIQIGIRNIWLLQNRFHFTRGKKVFYTLDQQRFRAAYDFLLLRKHESPEIQALGDWWTHIQTLSKTKQRDMVFPKKQQRKKIPKKNKK
ncbi:MAG: polynucleotide adenylyltransferase PcnB [Marinicellaceae bacterium]